MKANLTILIPALIVGYLGGISSQYYQSSDTSIGSEQTKRNSAPLSTFQQQDTSSDVTLQIAQLHEKIISLEIKMKEIAQAAIVTESHNDINTKETAGKRILQSSQIVPIKDDLLSAGVHPDTADDILRRISQHQFRIIELQNLIERNDSSDIQQYREELRDLNQNKISLRSELGDVAYDKYLVASNQNNRMKVSSVIPGSPAESNGIQNNDVILKYGDERIFSWHDIREATLMGDIGSFTNVEVLRDDVHMNLVVPSGTLGVQLEAIQLDPSKYQ